MTNRTHFLPRSTALEERFWSKVDRSAGPQSCWPWLAGLNGYGYGSIIVSKSFGRIMAHRLAYVLMVGPIPDGMCLDHLCHSADGSCALVNDCPHRRCVNPAHLEPVTQRENVKRGHDTAPSRQRAKTHCPQGHSYDEHGYQATPGRWHRKCRICQREAVRKSMAKARARAAR